jgi:hypothetical protein
MSILSDGNIFPEKDLDNGIEKLRLQGYLTEKVFCIFSKKEKSQ